MSFAKIEPKKENFSFSISNILNESSKPNYKYKNEQLEKLDEESKKLNEHHHESIVNENDDVEQDYDEDLKDTGDENEDVDDDLDADTNEDELESENEDFESKSNEANSESSYLLNNESFVNFCRTYGIDLASQSGDNNKYLLKMLMASSSQPPTLYNSWFSNWFSNTSANNSSVVGLGGESNSTSILNKKSNLNTSESSIGEGLLDIKTPTIFQKRVGHPYQNRNPPKRKKPRTSFNRPQIVELEKRFMKQKYLASNERSSLAKLLKMTDAQVKTWFQNRRTKWRRQNVEEKEAQRQAANKIIMSFKQQQNQQSTSSFNSAVDSEKLNLKTIQSDLLANDTLTFQNRLSSLQAAVAAAAAAAATNSLQQASIMSSLVGGKSGLGDAVFDLAQNPFAKLINLASSDTDAT